MAIDMTAFDAIQRKVAEGVSRLAHDIERKAKQNLSDDPKRVDTGTLRRSIQTQIDAKDTQITATVSTSMPYAIYVHEGTGIKSRTGSGRTDVPWRYYDARRGQWVSTSGMEANPFLEKAYNDAIAHINDYFDF